MRTLTESDQLIDEMFLAGENAPSGTYKQIGTTREVRLDRDDILPASLDGRVACYVRVTRTWSQILELAAA